MEGGREIEMLDAMHKKGREHQDFGNSRKGECVVEKRMEDFIPDLQGVIRFLRIWQYSLRRVGIGERGDAKCYEGQRSGCSPADGPPEDAGGGAEVVGAFDGVGAVPFAEEPLVLHALAHHAAGEGDLLAADHNLERAAGQFASVCG